MTTVELYEKIANEKQTAIFIGGKTSTGKSTFARKLQNELGYGNVELESVLLGVIKSHDLDEPTTFYKVLRDAGDSHESQLFFSAAHSSIAEQLKLHGHIVIEGAFSNETALARTLSTVTPLLFAYFHPAEIEVYIRNLTSRFMQSSHDQNAGLPMIFWKTVDKSEFDTFCKTRMLSEGLKSTIRAYAVASQRGSLQRLRKFQLAFKDVLEIEVQ
jgi:adenylate kinase family enzyme